MGLLTTLRYSKRLQTKPYRSQPNHTFTAKLLYVKIVKESYTTL